MRFLIYVLGFVAALMALEGLAALLSRRADPSRIRDRLRRLAPSLSDRDGGESGSILRARARDLGLGGLALLLYRAGAPISPLSFALLSLAMGLTPFFALLALTGSPLRALPTLVAGLLPWLVIKRRARARMRRFEEQLPDGIELLTRSLRAGHALGAGFQLVGDELADPIGTELGLVAEEIRLGLDIREALDNLMGRIDNPDLPYFATAVLIQRQTGGNLAELLDKLSEMLRLRRQFAGRVRALTAQGRGAATFLALWLPAIIGIVLLVAPEYLAPLFENTWGFFVLAGAFAIDALAYLMARRIADVQA